MKEFPILFSPEMVKAILAEEKTQTRRILKLTEFGPSNTKGYEWHYRDAKTHCWHDVSTERLIEKASPYGAVGDRLWVKEPYRLEPMRDHLSPLQSLAQGTAPMITYEADGKAPEGQGRFRNSRFMPRVFSRITLEITNIRIERLHEITEIDVWAEGCREDWPTDINGEAWTLTDAAARRRFLALWESIYGAGSSRLNPWLWVIEFKRVEVGV